MASTITVYRIVFTFCQQLQHNVNIQYCCSLRFQFSHKNVNANITSIQIIRSSTPGTDIRDINNVKIKLYLDFNTPRSLTLHSHVTLKRIT